MNFTAKSKLGPRRLSVQWLDAPAVGPLLICRRGAGYVSGTPPPAKRAAHVSCGVCGVRPAQQPAKRAALVKFRLADPAFAFRRLRAFTLLELMLVIAIIGFIAAVALPHVAGIGQANSMTSATRQLLDDVALARQRAMVNRSTVYMVFLPPMFWTNFWTNASFSPSMYGQQVSNLMMHQYSAYALVSLATVGDQPGQHHPQYVTDWRILPSGVFIAPFEFTLANAAMNATTNIFTTNTLAGTTVVSPIQQWQTVTVPFPSLYSTNTYGANTSMLLPCIGFTPQGSLTTRFVNQYIALARGSIFYPTDTNGVPLFQPPNLAEVPPGNDVRNPNLIQIDWMTARPTLVQNQMQ
jgi:prepilin-type N-terminal cleavage/methylation domain-containing protein